MTSWWTRLFGFDQADVAGGPLPTMRLPGRCPRCGPTERLAPRVGVLHDDVCPACGGRFLASAAAEQLLVVEAGLEREQLVERLDESAREGAPCPGCARPLSPIAAFDVVVQLCRACGGLWCDAGQMASLSQGRLREVKTERDSPSSSASQRTIVMQRELPFAGEDLLVRAFRSVPRLARADALRAARGGTGVVAEALTDEEAHALVGALVAGGVAAAAVAADDATLPRARETVRIDVEEGAIAITDQYGQPLRIPWDDVDAIALGIVPIMRSRFDAGGQWAGNLARSDDELVESIRLRNDEDVLLDVIVRGREHLRVSARRIGLPPGTPAHERPAHLVARARNIGERAARATLTPSARACFEQGALRRFFEGSNFERELLWTWWRARAG